MIQKGPVADNATFSKANLFTIGKNLSAFSLRGLAQGRKFPAPTRFIGFSHPASARLKPSFTSQA